MRADLSVIMPNYNHGWFLEKAISAIMEQSVQPAEVILVDDGSTDESLSVMEVVAAKYPEIRIIKNGENVGTTISCNRALEIATGKYLLFAAADDIVLPGLFEIGLEYLTLYPESAMCCFTYIMYDEETGNVKEFDYYWGDTPRYISPEEMGDTILGWSIQTQGTIYRRSMFEMSGGLRHELKWHSDWFLNHVLAFRHGICYVPKPLTIRREHIDSYSHQGRCNWDAQQKVIKYLIDFLCSEEYRDILPYVALSGLMGFFDRELDRLFLSDPTYWDTEKLVIALPVLTSRFQRWWEKRKQIYKNLKETDLKDYVLNTFSDL